MRMLAEKQVILGSLLFLGGKFTVLEFSIYRFLKKLFLVIPGFLIVDKSQVFKKYRSLYSGIFDNSDFNKSMDLMSIMSTLFSSER